MIVRQEIVSDEIYDTLEQEIQENIGELLKRINMIHIYIIKDLKEYSPNNRSKTSVSISSISISSLR